MSMILRIGITMILALAFLRVAASTVLWRVRGMAISMSGRSRMSLNMVIIGLPSIPSFISAIILVLVSVLWWLIGLIMALGRLGRKWMSDHSDRWFGW